jgi:hypothetical protein
MEAPSQFLFLLFVKEGQKQGSEETQNREGRRGKEKNR